MRRERESNCNPWIIGALILLAFTGIFAALWINRTHQEQPIATTRTPQSVLSQREIKQSRSTEDNVIQAAQPRMPPAPSQPKIV